MARMTNPAEGKLAFSDARTVLALMALWLCAGSATAGDPFPGYVPDQRMVKTQQRVDKLFEKGHYDRALVIYRDELAPLGDKFAQYMVGYMHLTGAGVEEDAVVAGAWYQLAAERGNPKFVSINDALHGLLNEEQQLRSEALFTELMLEMGDVAIVSKLVGEDLRELAGRRAALGPFDFLADRGEGSVNASYYRVVRDRIVVRLEFLREQLELRAYVHPDLIDRLVEQQRTGWQAIDAFDDAN